MAFTDLSAGSQNYLLVSHSYLLKWLVFLILIGLSIYYIFFMWKEQKPTPYFTQAIFRLLFLCLGVVYLVLSPWSIMMMTPEYSFYEFYVLPLTIYTVFMSIFTVVALFDLLKYGPLVLLKLAGMDMKDYNVNRIASAIENNKHFLRFKKR